MAYLSRRKLAEELRPGDDYGGPIITEVVWLIEAGSARVRTLDTWGREEFHHFGKQAHTFERTH